MRMPAKLKTKWLKALRSGTYKQAKGTLYNPKTAGFCCLGVLQHVEEKGCVEVDSFDNYCDVPSVQWMDAHGIELDLDAGHWSVEEDAQIECLINMNDGSKNGSKVISAKKFTTIANWIEKNVEAY